MKTLLFCALLLPSIAFAANDGELSARIRLGLLMPKGIQVERGENGDSTFVEYRHLVTSADTLGLDETAGFSPGGTLDAPELFERGRAMAATLTPYEYLLVRGTASVEPHRWIGERPKRWHAFDVLAGIARAKTFADSVNVVYPGSVRFDPEPIPGQEFRGIVVWRYRVVKTALSPIRTATQPVIHETVVREITSQGSETRIGVLGGYYFLPTNDRTVNVPGFGLALEKPYGRLDLGIGWRSAGRSEAFGPLADAMTFGILTWFPKAGAVGPFLGWVGATRYVRDETEYLQISNGPVVGAMLRYDRFVAANFKIGLARISTDEIGGGPRWTNGSFVAIQVGKSF